jgi:hypothetical protein
MTSKHAAQSDIAVFSVATIKPEGGVNGYVQPLNLHSLIQPLIRIII